MSDELKALMVLALTPFEYIDPVKSAAGEVRLVDADHVVTMIGAPSWTDAVEMANDLAEDRSVAAHNMRDYYPMRVVDVVLLHTNVKLSGGAR